MEFEGVGAVVAGGASGLGAAAVRLLHQRGAHVVIADLNDESGSDLAQELGERASFIRVDVTNEAEVQQAVELGQRVGSGLRVAVCSAGVGWAEKTTGRRGPHQAMPFETVLRVNVIGSFNLLRLAATAMTTNEPLDDGERGVCILTSSIAAFDGQIGQLAYAASKGAVASMTLPAARDLAANGVRVCTIAPGLFDTPLLASLPQAARDSLAKTIPFPSRFGLPKEYAQLAGQIVENRMLNGETIRLDGALRMAPK